MQMTNRALRVLLCVAVSLVLFSCGGGMSDPYHPGGDTAHIPPVQVFAYVPFVEQVTFPDVITAGEAFEVKFEIQTPDLPDGSLYFMDTSEDPMVAVDSVAQMYLICLYLQPLAVPAVLYDRSGTVIMHVFAAHAGQSELVYWAASSTEDAGVYDLGSAPFEKHIGEFRVPIVVRK